MGKHTEQTIATYREQSKSLFGKKAQAKCPMCEKMHTIQVGRMPNKLLRIFCPDCKQLAERGYEKQQ